MYIFFFGIDHYDIFYFSMVFISEACSTERYAMICG